VEVRALEVVGEERVALEGPNELAIDWEIPARAPAPRGPVRTLGSVPFARQAASTSPIPAEAPVTSFQAGRVSFPMAC